MKLPATDTAVLENLDLIMRLETPPARKAKLVAEAIRAGLGHRWVGLYSVGSEEIAVLAWSGPEAPAHPRFPVDQGLCGSAVTTQAPVVVGDVLKDSRYLTTLGTTRSELIIPIVDPSIGRVIGLIDVESERVEAFDQADIELLTRCADIVRPIWTAA